MKYYFVVNPMSGQFDKEIVDNISKACFVREMPYEILYTQTEGDARRLARQIPDTEECVVFAVGGDGCVCEVLNGLQDAKNKILAVVPTGSGNDFDRTVKRLDPGIHISDIGKINDHYFINIACIGLDADVANNIGRFRNKKWVPKTQRFNVSLLYTFFKYKFKRLKIQMGEETMIKDCTILAIANGQYYGGGYRIAPGALLDDGMFDIYLVRKMAKIRILGVLAKLLRGKHEKSSTVTRYRDKKVIVDSDEDIFFNVDGELMSGKHFELVMEKDAVRIFYDPLIVNEILGIEKKKSKKEVISDIRDKVSEDEYTHFK